MVTLVVTWHPFTTAGESSRLSAAAVSTDPVGSAEPTEPAVDPGARYHQLACAHLGDQQHDRAEDPQDPVRGCSSVWPRYGMFSTWTVPSFSSVT